jgi:thioredoxin reductase (NADPH)
LNNVGIIGAGPAGIAASIYLKRAGMDIALFEKDEIGGLLLNAYLVENYPGFPLGINGKKLCLLMKKQLKKWDIKPIIKEVKKITIEKKNFIINTQDTKIKFKAVILATGTIPKEINISGEHEIAGKLLFYEIKDLLPKLKPGNICNIIGCGDAAFDYALNLDNNGVAVEIYFRSKTPKCLTILKKRAKKCTDIHMYPCFTPIAIKEIEGKPVITFKSTDNKAAHVSKPDFVLIACGRYPNKKLLPIDFEKRNIPGLFIAGDVRAGNFRQAGIAVGEGINAAMNVETYLKGIKND